MEQHPPVTPPPSGQAKARSVLRSFALGATIEAALHIGYLTASKKPIAWLSLARSALFSGIAVTIVNQLSKAKPVAAILEVPVEPTTPVVPSEPTPSPKNWVEETAKYSQNGHTTTAARV